MSEHNLTLTKILAQRRKGAKEDAKFFFALSLRLCAFAPLRLCAFAPLRLCAFARDCS